MNIIYVEINTGDFPECFFLILNLLFPLPFICLLILHSVHTIWLAIHWLAPLVIVLIVVE